MVLLTKVFQFLTGFTSKIAELFGLKSFIGISGGTIVSALSIIVFCIFCGYLVRVSFFKSISGWVDKKLMYNIPGYSVYREMALSKLEKNDKALPFKSVVTVMRDDVVQPAFLIEKMPDERLVIFFPTAGNSMEGEVLIMKPEQVKLFPEADMKEMKIALDNLGIGLSGIDGI